MIVEQELKNEIKENSDSEQLVNSAASILEQIDVPELADVKQKILIRQEEIQSKSR